MAVDFGLGPVPLGTLPNWGLLLAVIIGWWKYGPTWKSQSFREAEAMCTRLGNEVRELKERLEKCETECAAERRQRVQEQISLINAIINSVDAPELQGMLRTLESVQITLEQNSKIRNLNLEAAAGEGNGTGERAT